MIDVKFIYIDNTKQGNFLHRIGYKHPNKQFATPHGHTTIHVPTRSFYFGYTGDGLRTRLRLTSVPYGLLQKKIEFKDILNRKYYA
jgi:hypothetical protein